MGCGGFKEWVWVANFRDGFEEFIRVGQMAVVGLSGKFQGLVWGVCQSGTDGVLGCSNQCGLVAMGRLGLGIAWPGLASSKLGLSKMEGMRMDRERRKTKEEDRKERKKRKILLTVAWRGRGRQSDWLRLSSSGVPFQLSLTLSPRVCEFGNRMKVK